MERDPTVRAVTEAVKLLNDVAAQPLIAESAYVELRELARAAKHQVPELVAAIGRLKASRAPRRADD